MAEVARFWLGLARFLDKTTRFFRAKLRDYHVGSCDFGVWQDEVLTCVRMFCLGSVDLDQGWRFDVVGGLVGGASVTTWSGMVLTGYDIMTATGYRLGLVFGY